MEKQSDKKIKTIFISIFQGVEAKNILRTPILETLLKDENVRIILFTDSKDRAEHYQKEYKNDRLIYEVISARSFSAIDSFLSKLKFTLLKTGTTDLERMMLREEGRGLLWHWVGKVLNTVLARPSVRKIVRMLDLAFVRDKTYKTYFDRYAPDLIFLAFLFDEKEVHMLREAKKRGIKSIGLINSWDHVTSRCMLRLLPDMFVVYNHMVKQELIRYQDADVKCIYVGGIAQYDEYASYVPKPREEFFADIKADPKKKLMIYASMGKAFSSSEWTVIDMLYGLNAAGAFGNDLQILVRFQPNDFVDQAELTLRPHLLYDYPGTRFTKSRGVGVDWDMDKKEVQHLSDTLHYADMLASYASSISIDAALFDLPVINIGFTTGKFEVLRESPMQYYRTEHYKKAVATGGIRLVSSVPEFCVWVKKYLENSSLDHAGRRKLVETQCVFEDGKSGERIGTFLLQQMR